MNMFPFSLLFDDVSSWSSVGLTAAISLCAVSSIIFTTKSVTESLKEQIRGLISSTEKLTNNIQGMMIDIARRSEQSDSIIQRVTALEAEVVSVRKNFHQLRNAMLAANLNQEALHHIDKE